MLNLAIQHVIHLTRNQRYALHDGICLVVTGLSVPVWYLDKDTSEPAREIFCKYYLKNAKEDHAIEVKPDGYELTLPFREGKGLEISDDDWRELKMKNPDKLEHMYEQCLQEVSSKNLLDVTDGGGTYLSYREHNEITQKDGSKLHMVHFVQMYDISQLQESLC